MNKAEILREAAEIVGQRGLSYGSPEDNFARIARRWNTHLFNRYESRLILDEIDVAAMMADLKLARIENEPGHMDSWKDLAGYAARGGEIASKRDEQPIHRPE